MDLGDLGGEIGKYGFKVWNMEQMEQVLEGRLNGEVGNRVWGNKGDTLKTV